ncbi:uncharacterized protein LOC111332313 [Stylophora pistillata]|nr:uncharacterized protein LOC111332313 [Stylophora pistillata]
MEKYSYREITKLFREPLENIKKVCQDIGINAIIRYDKWTPLHVASAQNRPDVTEYLISMGSDVNALDKEGKSPLYYCQSEEAAKMLVNAGAEVNHRSILGKTPLQYACISTATPETVKVLLQSGAQVNAEDKFGDTPFLYACGMAYGCIDEEEYAQNLPKINILIDYGADVHHTNLKGENGLHICSSHRTYEIAEILLKHGVTVDTLNKKHQTPLMRACSQNKTGLHREDALLVSLVLLLEYGADPAIPEKQGMTPLHVLMLYNCSSLMSKVEVASSVEVLLKHGASLNSVDKMLRTPVHYASYKADFGRWTEILEQLMMLGGDVNAKDVEGFSAVHVTAVREQSQTTGFQFPWDCICENEKLVQEIYWNSARKQGVTVAHTVFANKELRLGGGEVPWNVNGRDDFMSTPLHYAEFSSNTSVIKYLEFSSETADVTLRNCLDESPMDCALSAFNQEMVESFKNHGGSSTYQRERKLPGSSCELCACFALEEGEGISSQPFEKREESISIDAAEVQISPVRNMEEYLSHVLHTPRIGKVAVSDAEVDQVYKETENLIVEILRRVAERDHRFRSTMMMSGSVREQTKAGLPDEFDFMCNLEEFSSSLKVVDEDSCSPGFVRLKRRGDNANIDEFFDADGNLVPYLVRAKFEQTVRVVMFDSSLWRCCRICSNFLLPSCDIGVVRPKPSIIIELCWNGPVYKNMLYSVDLVPVIDAGEFWPMGAISYSSVLENVPKRCLFAMTIPRFEHGIYGNEVRISFSLMESKIFDKLPEVVKDAYITAKAIRELCPALVDSQGYFYDEANFTAQKLIPSFWLKMALFHELDKSGLKESSSLSEWVRRIFKRIYQCICEDNTFPSFIIPQQDFLASKFDVKGETSSTGEKLEKELKALKKLCQIIHRFLSSDG